MSWNWICIVIDDGIRAAWNQIHILMDDPIQTAWNPNRLRFGNPNLQSLDPTMNDLLSLKNWLNTPLNKLKSLH